MDSLIRQAPAAPPADALRPHIWRGEYQDNNVIVFRQDDSHHLVKKTTFEVLNLN